MVKAELVPYDRVDNAILIVRGHRVMLDRKLDAPYEVGTKALNQAVKCNIERFSSDFMFQLTEAEVGQSDARLGTSSGSGGRR